MKHFIYILLLALLAVAVVSFAFWLITGELHIVAPILGALLVVILSVNAQSKLQPVDIGFGMVSPAIGDCVKGPAFCSSSSALAMCSQLLAWAVASWW